MKKFLKTYRYDILLIGGILICAGILWAVLSLRSPGAYVRIEKGTKTVLILPLSKDCEVFIPKEWEGEPLEAMMSPAEELFENPADGAAGNRIIVYQGKVHVEDATCPDKICENQGEKSKVGDTIVCLPHQLVVTVISAEEAREETEAGAEKQKETDSGAVSWEATENGGGGGS